MKNKWNILYVIFVVMILFSLIGVPKIAESVIDETKDKIVTIAN